jgi:hypothetical protein
MINLREAIPPILFSAICAGCSGLTQIQDTVTKFDQGAHTVSTAQIAFIKSAQTADCNFQFYQNALSYSVSPDPAPHIPLDLASPCVSTIVTKDQLSTRQNLLNAITLYADQIQSLASEDSDKTLSGNAQTAANNINGLAKNHGLLGSNGLPIAADVETAVIQITGMVLSAKQLSDIKASARAQSDNLKSIVGYLKQENTDLANTMVNQAGSEANTLESIIGLVKQDGILVSNGRSTVARSNNPQVYLLTLTARQMLLNTPPTGISLSATGGSAQDPLSVASQLNNTLDGLVTANDAIANASTGGAIADVSDLVARAQAAQTMQAALAK